MELQQDNETLEKEIQDLPVIHLPEVVRSKKEIKIEPEPLGILRRLFLSVQEKQKELEELKTRLDIAVLMSLTTNGVLESEVANWRTNLDDGVHRER